jgi:hypothetical protein
MADLIKSDKEKKQNKKNRNSGAESPYVDDPDKPNFMEGTEDEKPANEDSENDWSGSSSPMAGKIYGTMEDLERATEEEILTSDEVKECIQECLICYRTCTETTIKCINTGGKHSEGRHLNLLMDCAKICNSNTNFMLRNSRYYPQTCALTAEICDKCADDCDRFDEEFMKNCASVCQHCAKSCREMAK